jgi:hypothetical protein
MRNRAATLALTAAAAVLVAVNIGPKPAPRFVWNASESVPTGLYGVEPAQRFIVTDLVVAFPPSSSRPSSSRADISRAAYRSSSAFWRCRDRSSVAGTLRSASTASRWAQHVNVTAATACSLFGKAVERFAKAKSSS